MGRACPPITFQQLGIPYGLISLGKLQDGSPTRPVPIYSQGHILVCHMVLATSFIMAILKCHTYAEQHPPSATGTSLQKHNIRHAKQWKTYPYNFMQTSNRTKVNENDISWTMPPYHFMWWHLSKTGCFFFCFLWHFSPSDCMAAVPRVSWWQSAMGQWHHGHTDLMGPAQGHATPGSNICTVNP